MPHQFMSFCFHIWTPSSSWHVYTIDQPFEPVHPKPLCAIPQLLYIHLCVRGHVSVFHQEDTYLKASIALSYFYRSLLSCDEKQQFHLPLSDTSQIILLIPYQIKQLYFINREVNLISLCFIGLIFRFHYLLLLMLLLLITVSVIVCLFHHLSLVISSEEFQFIYPFQLLCLFYFCKIRDIIARIRSCNFQLIFEEWCRARSCRSKRSQWCLRRSHSDYSYP